MLEEAGRSWPRVGPASAHAADAPDGAVLPTLSALQSDADISA